MLVPTLNAVPQWKRWNDEFIRSSSFRSFCKLRSAIQHLILSNDEIDTLRENCLTSPISVIREGMTVYVDIRTWGSDWYSTLSLPDKDLITYVTTCVYGSFCGPSKNPHSLVNSIYPEMCGETFVVDNWFVTRNGCQNKVGVDEVLLTSEMIIHFDLGPVEVKNRLTVGSRKRKRDLKR